MATVHSGLPVAEHGLYEWHLLDPSLNRLITPLLFSFAGDGARETLAGVLDPEDVYPDESAHVRRAAAGIPSSVALNATIAASSTSRVLLRSADVLPFSSPEEGLAATAAWLARRDAGDALVYLEGVDSLMHVVGPDDPAVDVAFGQVLDAVERTEFPPGTLVVLTADHGMAPVHPVRTVYVNRVWPELAGHLATGADGKPLAPAGSCRDLFLHVRPGEVETVRDGLAERLDGVADVLAVETLVADGVFSEPSPRLRARLADVVVLPRYGEAVYWYERGRFEQALHGQHGGLSPEEMEIPLLAWVA